MKLNHHDLTHILDHTREIWNELKGARLFVTGGTGFFGHWLLESFAYANQQLDLKASASVLSRDPDAAKRAFPHLRLDPAINLLKGDIRNFEFPAGKYSHIIHAATEASAKLNNESPLLMLDTIIEGTRHALDFALQCQAEKFLFISSGAIYGKQPDNLTHIPEEYDGVPNPLEMRSAYGIGKLTAEHLCALYSKQSSFHTTIARCFAFVGPSLPLDAHFAIGNFILDGLNNRPISIKGDGTPYRSYLYAADLAIWLWTILLRGQSGRAYNVGSDNDLQISQAANIVGAQFETRIQINILGTRDTGKLQERYVPSILRARQELSLDDWIPIDEGVRRTIEFYRAAK